MGFMATSTAELPYIANGHFFSDHISHSDSTPSVTRDGSTSAQNDNENPTDVNIEIVKAAWMYTCDATSYRTVATRVDSVIQVVSNLRKEKQLSDLPMEILTDIADILEHEDVLSLRATSKSLANGIEYYVFATTRFFGRLRVRTSNEGLVRLGCISDSPYAHLVKTLEIQPVVESSEDPQSDIYWPEPSKCTFMGLDITPFHYFHTNHSEHPMKELLHRVFHQMKNLRSVVFLAPRLSFRGSDAAKWKGWYAPRMLQCKIINTLFGIIKDAISKLDCVALEGFSSIVGEHSPLRHSLALPPSMPLDFKRYVASHKGLQIEYNPPRDRDGRVYDEMAFRSRGKLQNTWDSLLSALSCDRMAKSLEISIAGISLQQRVYGEERGLHYDAMVADAVFHHLSFRPSLFLHTLKLHQVHASGKCTVDQVIRVHTPTLREVYLDDFWLEPPNVARDLFEALASANLEYLGLRRFYWRKKFLGTRSLDCSKDHDPDLALDWPEQPADDTTDGTHESIVSEDDVALGRIEPSRSKQKDESYKDWVLMDWVQDDIDNWMEYGMHKKNPHEKSTHMVHGPVNTAMRRIVTRIDSGAIFAP